MTNEIEQPSNLNIQLYRHQRVSVHKMENLERFKRLSLEN